MKKVPRLLKIYLVVLALAIAALVVVSKSPPKTAEPAEASAVSNAKAARPMPVFKGDRSGQPTQEDYEKAAQWLLDRDKEREKDR
jgi:hypothetical protein